jgi:hypothetical protein
MSRFILAEAIKWAEVSKKLKFLEYFSVEELWELINGIFKEWECVIVGNRQIEGIPFKYSPLPTSHYVAVFSLGEYNMICIVR